MAYDAATLVPMFESVVAQTGIAAQHSQTYNPAVPETFGLDPTIKEGMDRIYSVYMELISAMNELGANEVLPVVVANLSRPALEVVANVAITSHNNLAQGL